jgi:hypothetical protein
MRKSFVCFYKLQQQFSFFPKENHLVLTTNLNFLEAQKQEILVIALD